MGGGEEGYGADVVTVTVTAGGAAGATAAATLTPLLSPGTHCLVG